MDAGNLNNVLYDPDSGQVLLTSGRRDAVTRVYRLDPACDCVRAQLDLPAAKLDAPVLLGPGLAALPLRDEGRVAVIDLRRMAVTRLWQPPSCPRPGALAADPAGARLFVACRGADPRVLSLDAASGAVLASAPAGTATSTRWPTTLGAAGCWRPAARTHGCRSTRPASPAACAGWPPSARVPGPTTWPMTPDAASPICPAWTTPRSTPPAAARRNAISRRTAMP
ncbi:hypothetical protein WJ968_04760 [Achromobacter xylosoxidans]